MENYSLPLSRSISFGRKSFYELIKEAHELGYEYIDFDMCSWRERPLLEKLSYTGLDRGFEAVKALGIKVNGVHISFGFGWDPSETNEKKRKKIVRKIINVIHRVDPHKPFCYVLHGSFEPVLNAKRESKKEALIASLKEICAATNTLVCVETLPRTCLLNTAKEANEILDRADLPNLKICLDTNHFLQEKTEDAILALAGRVATLHVSDHDYVNERHFLPGKGKIDWNAVLAALEKTGYRGVFNYEVKDSLAVVKENYEKLFEEYNKTR